MPDYKVYLFDEHGRVRQAVMLECPDDRIAIQRAETLREGMDMEIWRDACLIERITVGDGFA